MMGWNKIVEGCCFAGFCRLVLFVGTGVIGCFFDGLGLRCLLTSRLGLDGGLFRMVAIERRLLYGSSLIQRKGCSCYPYLLLTRESGPAAVD